MKALAVKELIDIFDKVVEDLEGGKLLIPGVPAESVRLILSYDGENNYGGIFNPSVVEAHLHYHAVDGFDATIISKSIYRLLISMPTFTHFYVRLNVGQKSITFLPRV